jgi:hypothetical protein
MRTSAIRTSIVMACILMLSLWVAQGKDGATRWRRIGRVPCQAFYAGRARNRWRH